MLTVTIADPESDNCDLAFRYDDGSGFQALPNSAIVSGAVQNLDRAKALADIAQAKDLFGRHILTQAASSFADVTQARMKAMPSSPAVSPGSLPMSVSRGSPACAARIASAASV